jgi:hypothetical protein
MLWLAHLVWRLECRRERVVGGLDEPGDSYLLRHEARGTFIHKKRVITARCYGDVGSFA